MIHCAGKFGVRIEGEAKIKWFDSFVEADRYEFERLWAPAIRKAKAEGKRIILTADVARQAEDYSRED